MSIIIFCEIIHLQFGLGYVIPRTKADGQIKVVLEQLLDEKFDRLAKLFKFEIRNLRMSLK